MIEQADDVVFSQALKNKTTDIADESWVARNYFTGYTT